MRSTGRAIRIDDLLNEATSERMARAGNVAGELPSLLEPQLTMGTPGACGGGIETDVSISYVHKIAQQVAKDPEFRERMKRDPAAARRTSSAARSWRATWGGWPRWALTDTCWGISPGTRCRD